MYVASNQRPTIKSSMAWSLPWAGLAVCLIVLLAHVAYDVIAQAHTAGGGRSDSQTDAKAGADRAASLRDVSETDFKSKRPRSRSSRRSSTRSRPGFRSSG